MTINKSLEYVNGDTLDVDGHNENVYHATGLDHGIMSTANGRLAQSNLNSSFAFKAEHVMPGEVFRAHQDFQYETVDYFGDANANQTYSNYVNVAGAAMRVDLPYDGSIALWQCSFFCAFWVPMIEKVDPDTLAKSRAEPDAYVKLAIDGATVEHTQRRMPMSVYLVETATTRDTYEHYMSRPYDMSHMVQGLSAGWHDFQLKVYMQNLNERTLDVMSARGSDFGVNISQYIWPRVSFGVRNARVLTIL